jgi:hypothetical protein
MEENAWKDRMREHQGLIVGRARGTVPEQKEARLMIHDVRYTERFCDALFENCLSARFGMEPYPSLLNRSVDP